ncbi:uncharacterized protein LOC122722121 [Manihot esculenta]|uniref:Uncharacterized protein n=1 Tax=Manihot esculenta TaxID=3983 RepID=A0ACB7G6G4_MANES|nr:uncharacterized protein LOC122722121 [Manihot esculenta]XP_043807922.1 uncharacterized protein LOC122722121 [Manihot esculenta]XP_043807923.1 uncharacterized protein LOC122722121 [Manihot esculenta]XP_043807924.1 uncharacterized protein LOC122722121 [Manihot esculenta]XP_043807925.1 uncharacterized protein LOC122722121 [Manihot esculenta]XP_043807926.1 uncharacterized protein LOC122722121 [Manihot esculenta]XP_043807927.1 uncharacterized protein LOC122722121 [Manihot esculenta]XP_04380792
MTDKGKEVEKISLRSKTNISKTNSTKLQLFTSGHSSIQSLTSGQNITGQLAAPRPLYTNTTSIINRPIGHISSALITQPNYPRPRSPRPYFTSLNKFSPLQAEPIPPSTFKQIVTRPASPSPIASASSPYLSQVVQTQYTYKDAEDFVITIEPEYWAQNPNLNIYQLCESIFPKTHYYLPDNFQKSQSYYEALLVHTNSILIQNNYDPKNHTKLRYCKVRLLKVWTLIEWGQEPHRTKDFTLTNGQNAKYNYYDYQIAWERTFFKQNDQLSISFFFYISDTFTYPIPYWFHQWWNKFGIIETIIPDHIKLAQTQFFENNKLPDPIICSPKWLIYSHYFHIPWILMIEYQIKDQTFDNFQVPVLVRKYKIKWWAKTDQEACGPKAVDQFFTNYSQYCKIPNPSAITKQETFLARKKQIMVQMAACTSEQEYEKLLEELQETRSSSVSPSPADLADDNDDFFTQEM